MNVVIMKGRFTVDPQCSFADDGNCKAAQFGLAVRRDFVVRDGTDTDFFQCVAFKNQAKFIEKNMKKGKMVVIRGRFQNNNYTKDGQNVYGNQLIVDSIEPCEPKDQTVEEEFHPVNQQPFSEDTVPAEQ